MKVEFALQALEQNNWQYEKALEVFYALKVDFWNIQSLFC